MDELIKLVSKKAGISDSQAKKAIEAIMDYLKDNLPAPLDDQVENVLKGGKADFSTEEITDFLGGFLGKK